MSLRAQLKAAALRAITTAVRVLRMRMKQALSALWLLCEANADRHARSSCGHKWHARRCMSRTSHRHGNMRAPTHERRRTLPESRVAAVGLENEQECERKADSAVRKREVELTQVREAARAQALVKTAGGAHDDDRDEGHHHAHHELAPARAAQVSAQAPLGRHHWAGLPPVIAGNLELQLQAEDSLPSAPRKRDWGKLV